MLEFDISSLRIALSTRSLLLIISKSDLARVSVAACAAATPAVADDMSLKVGLKSVAPLKLHDAVIGSISSVYFFQNLTKNNKDLKLY